MVLAYYREGVDSSVTRESIFATLQPIPKFFMTLFNQSKGRPRGDNERTRGDSNRTLGRRKVGRGGPGGRLRSSKKASFNSTRIEEKNENESNQSEEASETDAELEPGSDDLSSDEDNANTAVSAIKPYGALLQSLNDTTQRGQPQRKKQKKSVSEVFGNIDAVEDVDLVIEPEEAEAIEIGEFTEDDGDDEAEKGLLLPCFLEYRAYVFRP